MTAGDPVSAWGGAAGAGTGVVTSRRSPGAGQIHVCVTAAWDRVQQPDEGGQRGAVEISVDMQFRRVEETGDAQPTVVVYGRFEVEGVWDIDIVRDAHVDSPKGASNTM